MDIKRTVTGKTLKIIAMATMLLDHVAVGFWYMHWYHAGFDMVGWFSSGYMFTYRVMRLIGRIAFPLYCFMLVEGLEYTRDIKKYMLRILALAVISEVPFDMALESSWFYPQYNNVLWTLALGLGAIATMKWSAKEIVDTSEDKQMYFRVLYYAAPILACLIALFAHTDYSYVGVICIVCLYVLSYVRKYNFVFSYIIIVVILTIGSGFIEIAALVGAIPVALYSGKRGNVSKAFNRFSYLFYPLHLGLIALIYSIFG